MESLQKFKHFAAQCGLEAAPAASSRSPTLSPTKSPVFHLRRRKTLRMLLNRTSENRRSELRHMLEESSPESDRNCGKNNKKEKRGRRKLKELFVSSPSPPPFEDREKRSGGELELGERREMLPATASSSAVVGGGEFVTRRIGSSGSLRPFRSRILRKPWRPVLVSVPEQ